MFLEQWDSVVILEGTSITLPTNVALHVRTILGDYVELDQPITKKGIIQLARATKVNDDSVELEKLARDGNNAGDIAAKRPSALDLLEMYPSIQFDLCTFLLLLPAMRLRQ